MTNKSPMRLEYYRAGGYVHLGSPIDDRTLCGDALEGDEEEGVEQATRLPAAMTITCPTCCRIIKHCKKVRKYEKEPTND